jgi:hypothetical protein
MTIFAGVNGMPKRPGERSACRKATGVSVVRHTIRLDLLTDRAALASMSHGRTPTAMVAHAFSRAKIVTRRAPAVTAIRPEDNVP